MNIGVNETYYKKTDFLLILLFLKFRIKTLQKVRKITRY